MRRPLFLCCLFFVAVFALLRLTGWSSRKEDDSHLTVGRELTKGDWMNVSGQVYQKEKRLVFGKERLYIYLKSVSILDFNASDSEAAVPASFNLICELEGDAPEPDLGSRLKAEGEFAPYSPATNPGQFDSWDYYNAQGVGGALKKAVILSKEEEGSWFLESLYRLRGMWKERLYRVFPKEEASVLATMLLGDKGGLDSELKELYKKNGIVHILSISGLHITMIGMGFYKGLRKTGVNKKLCAAAGGVLLVCYGIMTGMGVSALRAIGMYVIRMAGECLGRTYDMLTALGIMAVFILAGSPGYLSHSGFLLSFGSVLGIGVFQPVLIKRGKRKGKAGCRSKLEWLVKCKDGLIESMGGSLSVILFTLPVQLGVFYEVPVYSVFLNMLVLPFMGMVMAVGIMVMLLPGIGGIGLIDQAILGGYQWLCLAFEKLPGHTWSPGCPSGWQIGVFYAGVLMVVLAGKRWHFWQKGLVLAVLVMVLGYRHQSGVEVFFLDVGQGDCIIVRTDAGENYLFDGGSSSTGSPGKNIIIPFLKHQGIREITAVISHPDSDHVNGILELMEEGPGKGIEIKRIMLPAIEQNARDSEFANILDRMQQEELYYVGAKDMWKSGNVTFQCLHPQKGYEAGDSNGYSLCLRMEYGSFSMLLTGDVEGAGEEALFRELAQLKQPEVTVLKVAHHGSRNSTSSELLEMLKPQFAVISCGKDNSYGHPHKELMERLEERDGTIMETYKSGAVSMKIAGGRLRMKTFCAQ